MKKSENRIYRPAKRIVIAGMATALLIGGKEALAAIPNVEIVTLLCAVYGFTLGPLSLVCILAFVTCEGVLYGFGSWIVSYYIYWPLAGATFMALKKLRGRPRIIVPTVAAVLLTAFFSVLTSLVDVGLLTGFYVNFWQRFAVYYARGFVFYIVQTVCNLMLFPVAFAPLCRAAEKCAESFREKNPAAAFGTPGSVNAPPDNAKETKKETEEKHVDFD